MSDLSARLARARAVREGYQSALVRSPAGDGAPPEETSAYWAGKLDSALGGLVEAVDEAGGYQELTSPNLIKEGKR